MIQKPNKTTSPQLVLFCKKVQVSGTFPEALSNHTDMQCLHAQATVAAKPRAILRCVPKVVTVVGVRKKSTDFLRYQKRCNRSKAAIPPGTIL